MAEEKNEKKYTTISIPSPLAEKIKKRIEGTGFNSLSSYVTYVLREVISGMDDEEDEEAFSKEDEEKVKERLRALGYLD
jgi:Arc/MetJ-type ribon-helix-helix transcriptional regulator